MPWRLTTASNNSRRRYTRRVKKGCEMPKLKTKSGAKKRFKLTATGKVKCAQAGKRHGMIKRSNKFIRDARGTTTLSEPDARIVKQFLPYG
jgi:large subunit ribosomal protein L35